MYIWSLSFAPTEAHTSKESIKQCGKLKVGSYLSVFLSFVCMAVISLFEKCEFSSGIILASCTLVVSFFL